MSELVMFGQDGETLVPFPVLREKVNADLAQLAATKKHKTDKEQQADVFGIKNKSEGLFGEVRDGDQAQ